MVRDGLGLALSSWSGAAVAATLALLMPVVGAAQRTEGIRPRSLESRSSKITGQSGVIPGAFVTAVLGAGVGAMVGSASPRWHRRFP